jgi:hypothetical protein
LRRFDMNMFKRFLLGTALAFGLSASAHSAASWPNAVPSDSTLYLTVNNCQTALTSSINNVVTTIGVVGTACFPSNGFITIDTEVIKYTGKTGTTFTGCTRASDGTSAAAHLNAKPVSHYVIAAHHNALKDELIAMTTYFLQGDQIHITTTSTPDMLGLGTSTPAYHLDIWGNGTSGAVAVSTSTTGSPKALAVNTSGNVTANGSVTAASFAGVGSSLTLLTPTNLNASGTPSASTYLRGDSTWATVVTNSQTLFTSTASVSVSNTASTTTLLGAGVGSLTLSANTLTAGKTIRLHISGVMSDDGAAPGTIDFITSLGAVTVSTTSIFDLTSGGYVGLSNSPWEAILDITCRTTGASGSVVVSGHIQITNAVGAAGAAIPAGLKIFGFTATTIDTTASNVIDFKVHWDTVDTDNSITQVTATVEALN